MSIQSKVGGGKPAKPKAPSAKRIVRYCPQTYFAGRSLEQRPERVIPYPATVEVPSTEVLELSIETEFRDGTTTKVAYAIPIKEVVKETLGPNAARAKITRL